MKLVVGYSSISRNDIVKSGNISWRNPYQNFSNIDLTYTMHFRFFFNLNYNKTCVVFTILLNFHLIWINKL